MKNQVSGGGRGWGRGTIHNERIDILITRVGGVREGQILVRGQTFLTYIQYMA